MPLFAISILNPNYDVINDVISGFAKVVVQRCGFHHWIAQRIFGGEVVSVFLYLLQFSSYDVINDVIMSDADCNPGREPRSVAASLFYFSYQFFTSRVSRRRREIYCGYARLCCSTYW